MCADTYLTSAGMLTTCGVLSAPSRSVEGATSESSGHQQDHAMVRGGESSASARAQRTNESQVKSSRSSQYPHWTDGGPGFKRHPVQSKENPKSANRRDISSRLINPTTKQKQRNCKYLQPKTPHQQPNQSWLLPASSPR